jgi:hypothetical protein
MRGRISISLMVPDRGRSRRSNPQGIRSRVDVVFPTTSVDLSAFSALRSPQGPSRSLPFPLDKVT